MAERHVTLGLERCSTHYWWLGTTERQTTHSVSSAGAGTVRIGASSPEMVDEALDRSGPAFLIAAQVLTDTERWNSRPEGSLPKRPGIRFGRASGHRRSAIRGGDLPFLMSGY